MTYPSTQPAGPAYGMPTYLDSILSTLLVGAGAALVQHHTLTQPQLQDGVAAIISLLGIAWAVINANPNKRSPIATIVALVRASPLAQQAAYNAGVKAAEAAIVAKLTPIIHEQVKAHMGLFAGPVDGLADTALRQAADKGVAAITVSPAAGGPGPQS